MTISLTGIYQVEADQNLSFSNEWGFWFTGPTGLKVGVVSAGSISVTADEAFDTVIGVSTYNYTGEVARSALFENRAGATFEVVSTGLQAFAEGVDFSDSLRDVVVNDGSFSVSSNGGADGVFGNGLHLANSSDFAVTAALGAIGVLDYGVLTLRNSGDMEVTGANSVCINATIGGQIANSGILHATALSGRAVEVYFGGSRFQLVNTGEMRAEGSESVGVEFVHDQEFVGSIDNRGDITAATAILEDVTATFLDDAADVVRNFGTIHGDVLLTRGHDEVHNSGQIFGDVGLGDDDDLYDGARGRVTGTVLGGGGADTLIGGKSNDIIHGDDGAGGPDGRDVVRGRGGDDLLSGGIGADTLIGGAGVDVLTGGGGADVFVFEALRDSLHHHADTITDLRAHDMVDLSAIDADTGVGGDQAFELVSAFSGHAGELIVAYRKGTDLTVIQGDVDGDGRADFTLQAAGDHHDFAGFVF